MKCPKCGEEMDDGQIGCDGNILSWTKGSLSLKGDTLAWGPAASLKGCRCTKCRSIMVNY
jgi:hypothetical protein